MYCDWGLCIIYQAGMLKDQWILMEAFLEIIQEIDPWSSKCTPTLMSDDANSSSRKRKGDPDIPAAPYLTTQNTSTPSQPGQHSFYIVRSHAAHAQSPHLRPPPQSLQTDGDLPAFLFLKDEYISLAFLVSDARSQDVQPLLFTAL